MKAIQIETIFIRNEIMNNNIKLTYLTSFNCFTNLSRSNRFSSRHTICLFSKKNYTFKPNRPFNFNSDFRIPNFFKSALRCRLPCLLIDVLKCTNFLLCKVAIVGVQIVQLADIRVVRSQAKIADHSVDSIDNFGLESLAIGKEIGKRNVGGQHANFALLKS